MSLDLNVGEARGFLSCDFSKQDIEKLIPGIKHCRHMPEEIDFEIQEGSNLIALPTNGWKYVVVAIMEEGNDSVAARELRTLFINLGYATHDQEGFNYAVCGE